ncbi:MAG: insulinase family protein, partial [Eubacterium sp.]|nr:insulinase family protein [Eubacterium sp.]
LLKCFYHKNPVRIDIAGTVDSIAQITDTLLYDCYNTFYNLHNMALAVVGNVTVDDVLEVCDKFLKDAPPLSIERSFDDEPRDIVCDYKEHNLPVSIPTFSFGYKEACEKAIPTFRENILTDVLMEIIAGQTSTLYSRLVEDGLVDTSFGGSYFIGNGFETVIFEGESQDPETVAKAIKEEIASLKANGITEEQFEIARRSLYGQEIMSFNDTDTIANALIACDFNGWSLYDGLEIYQQITLQEVQERLNSMMDEKYSALSVVRNK